MASYVLHRRTARSARVVRAYACQRVRGLAKDQARDLESAWPGHCVALEIIYLSDAAHGDDEFRVAWHTGHVSDLVGERLGIRSQTAGCDHGNLDGGRNRGRNNLRPLLGSSREAPRNGGRVDWRDRYDTALGVFSKSCSIGRWRVFDAVHGSGGMGRYSGALG